jgi:predicted metal-dependent HD superfamily phosphohydrolase
MTDLLETRWSSLVKKFSSDSELISNLWADIKARYSEPQRYYHKLKHLECIFSDVDASGVSSDSIEFSVWFHDIIYNPCSSSNEKESAKIAMKIMNSLGANSAACDDVIYMIDATKHHENPRASKEADIFLDADMAILGVAESLYQDYLKNVRMEFSKTPDFLFRGGRRRFVQVTLEKDKIFNSDYFFKKYEAAARANLNNELISLK